MNFTADLVAEELYKLEIMKKYVLRTYSASREDIFNIKIKELPEYSVLYKMLFDTDILDQFTKVNTEAINRNDDAFSMSNLTRDLQAAKFQIEFYFG